MKRRTFIAGLGGVAAWPVVARAQQGERVRRIGFLYSLLSPDASQAIATVFAPPTTARPARLWIAGDLGCCASD
jgi:hypothetical protein